MASHMGRTDFEGQSTVSFFPPPQPAQLSGNAVFTAANGDQLYTSFTGTTFVNAQGQAIGNFVHQITGGTGRFSEASGTLIAHSVHNFAAPSGSLDFDGDLHY